MSVIGLQRLMKSGAYNFYWIAGLSLANSIYFLFITRSVFVVGLGITQFLDTIFHNLALSFPDSRELILWIGLLPDLFICCVFVLCGYLAVKRHRWAFIAGMILYGLDAVLTLVSGDVIGFGFHLFFLWFLFTGLQALDKLIKILPGSTSPSTSPENNK
jgi:hypothetical protein